MTLRRRLDIQRASDFQESGEFRAKVINDELDVLTASVQQVNDDAGRSLRLSPTDAFETSLEIPDKTTRSNNYLAFDANGDPVVGDPTGPQGPQGVAGTNGINGAPGADGTDGVDGTNGVDGINGTDPGMAFIWDDTVVATVDDVDQGNGKIFADNATLSSITAIYMDDVDANGGSVTPWVALLDDSTTTTNRGKIIIKKNSDTSNWAIFTVNGANTSKTGYTWASVAYVAHNGFFTDADAISVTFSATGDKGNAGAGTGDMLAANNLSDVANALTARANLGLGTAATANTGTGVNDVPTTTNADGRYLQQASDLSDLANAATARANLGLGGAAPENVAVGGTGDLLRADGDGSLLTNLPGGGGGGKLTEVHRTVHTATSSLATCASGGSQVGSNLTVNVPTAGMLRLIMLECELEETGGSLIATIGLGLDVGGTVKFTQSDDNNNIYTYYNALMKVKAGKTVTISGGYHYLYQAGVPGILFDIATHFPSVTGPQTVKVLMGDNADPGLTGVGQLSGATKQAVFLLEVIDGS
ncbi:MAG TPA: hypothetical protein ENI79_04195 [Rhodospirillales bacterium]|nr:hypothetical protein [Rhodospirillales bacterium]